MMLCGIKGANSVAKLLNSYLIRNFYGFYFEFYSTISRQGNNQASLPLLFWLIEMVPYSPFLTAFAWVARMFLTGNAIVMTAIEGVF